MAHTNRLRLAVVGIALTLTAACGGGTDPGAETITDPLGTIGIVMPNKTSPRWLGDGGNMVKQFQLLGYRTDLQFGEDDVKKQIAQLETMIADHDAALVITSIDGGALAPVLQKAADAKIPVIAYDRLIRDTPAVSYYATFDNFKVGVIEANYLVEKLGLKSGKGPFNIELFAGSADDNNAGFFFQGSMSILSPYIRSGKLKVRSGQTKFTKVTTLRWDGATAGKRMTKILAADYGSAHLDAVLSPYDGISRGIIAACTEAGYGTGSKPLPLITGQDAEVDSVKAIIAGTQSETVYKDTRELAKVAVQMTDSLLTGGTPRVNDTTQYNNGIKVVPTFLLQPVGVDRSNYKSVLIEGGYYTEAELS